MITEPFRTPYLYSHHENNIHEIILTEASKETVIEWMTLIEKIYQTPVPPHTPLLLLVDMRAGMLPLAYLVQQWSRLNHQHPQRPPLRLVFLHERDFLTSLIRASLQLSVLRRQDSLHFFMGSDRVKAVRWLLDYEAKRKTTTLNTTIQPEDLESAPSPNSESV